MTSCKARRLRQRRTVADGGDTEIERQDELCFAGRVIQALLVDELCVETKRPPSLAGDTEGNADSRIAIPSTTSHSVRYLDYCNTALHIIIVHTRLVMHKSTIENTNIINIRTTHTHTRTHTDTMHGAFTSTLLKHGE